MSGDGQATATATPKTAGSGLRQYLALSDRPLPRFVRKVRRGIRSISMPAPRLIVRPIVKAFLVLRTGWHFFLRVFICEPFLKANCAQYGQRLHTDIYLHWIQGKGDIIVGDDVTIEGKCGISFGARFADRPVLKIGDRTGIGHNCRFTIGKQITIGSDCLLSGDCVIVDSNGHPSDPAARLARLPPSPEDVRPVTIANNVWIGMRVMIFPGVKIGEGSVIAAGSVVRLNVPPYSVVAGNPASLLFRLKKPGDLPASDGKQELQ